MAFGGQVVLAHDLTGSQFRPASRQRPASSRPAGTSSAGPRHPGPGGTTPNGNRMPVMHAVSH